MIVCIVYVYVLQIVYRNTLKCTKRPRDDRLNQPEKYCARSSKHILELYACVRAGGWAGGCSLVRVYVCIRACIHMKPFSSTDVLQIVEVNETNIILCHFSASQLNLEKPINANNGHNFIHFFSSNVFFFVQRLWCDNFFF